MKPELKHLKPVVFVLCLLPLMRLLVLGLGDGLGANPLEFLSRSTGIWALVMLVASLSVTPLRWLTAQTHLLRLRRMLGLFSFFYLMLHMLCWIWFDHGFEMAELFRDIRKRPFILAGFVAMLMMWPLALTSNQAAIRALGRRWALLHRLVYPLAIVAVTHFWWMRAGKNNLREPMIYAAVLTLLFAIRLVRWASRRGKSAASS